MARLLASQRNKSVVVAALTVLVVMVVLVLVVVLVVAAAVCSNRAHASQPASQVLMDVVAVGSHRLWW